MAGPCRRRRIRWPTLRDNVTREVDRLNGIYIRLLDGAGVKLHMGRGRLMDRHTIEVGEQDDHRREDPDRDRRRSRSCPTSRAASSPSPPTRRSISTELPKRIAIVGGGYIAVEFAGIFNGLGAEVDLVLRRDRVLRGFDEECRTARARGADGKRHRDAHRDARSARIESDRRQRRRYEVHTPLGGMFETDLVMYATGRAPNTTGIGLEKVGVQLEQGRRRRRRRMVEDAPPSNIWAVGDVTDRINLTPVAIMEGHCFADTEFGNKPRKADHRNVPSAVFCQPEIANVGLTEEEARRTAGRAAVFTAAFRPMKHAVRTQPAHLHEADRRSRDRQGRGRPHGGRRCRRADPGPRGRRQGRRHQGPFRRHRRHSPDGRRGVRHHADRPRRRDPAARAAAE